MEDEKSDSQEMEFESVQLGQLDLPEDSAEDQLLVNHSDSILVDELNSFQCSECGKEYKSREGLRNHIRKIHSGVKQKSSLDQNCLEVGCDATFHSKSDLWAHLEKEHNLAFEELSIVLPTVPKFYAWMEEYQEATGTRFVRTCGSKQFARTGTRMQFVCHRSGKGRGKTTVLRLRKERTHGPVKLGIQCIVHLRVLEKVNGSVEVDGCVSHYGHTMDEQFMSLLPTHRCRIARFLNLGQPAHRVADIVKQLAHPSSPLARISSADVRNVEQCFSKHFTEVVASYMFSAIGCTLETHPNIVLVHKPNNVEVEGMDVAEFFGVIMTPSQLELFQEYSDCIEAVCVDTVCHFNFSVVTINCFVQRDGSLSFVFPLAWFITSSSEPQLHIQTFYYAVVGQTGKFNCNLFFSDDYDEYFVNFLHIFGSDKVPKKQVNFWQMRHALELALVQHIGEPTKIYSVSSLMDGIFRTPLSVEEFSRNLQQIQDVLMSETLPASFVDFFNGMFVNRSMLWAPCYIGEEAAAIYTEFEREHTTMLYFLDHMVMNRWGSKIISSLISYTSPFKVDTAPATQQAEEGEEPVAASSWSKEFVLEFDGGLFTVTKTGKTCKALCENRCQCCGLCVHEYNCSCWWEGETSVCEHIHTIKVYQAKEKEAEEEKQKLQQQLEQKPEPRILREKLPQHGEKLDLIFTEVRRLQVLLDRPETEDSLKTYVNQLQSLQNVINSLATSVVGFPLKPPESESPPAATASKSEPKFESHQTVHLLMTQNPQIVTVEANSKLPIMVPRGTSVDMIPPQNLVRWTANVKRNHKPLMTNRSLTQIILSNPGMARASILLCDDPDKVKHLVTEKRQQEKERPGVKVIRISKDTL